MAITQRPDENAQEHVQEKTQALKTLDDAVQTYVGNFLNTKDKKLSNFQAYNNANPVLIRLVRNFHTKENSKSIDTIIELHSVLGEESPYLALGSASRFRNTYESGLAMGFFISGAEFDLDKIAAIKPRISNEFVKGVKDGQIYEQKLLVASSTSRIQTYGLGALFLGTFGSYIVGFTFGDQDRAELARYLFAPFAAALPIWAYGMNVMYKTKLMSNDNHISRKLIKEGPFRYHRNPFYASSLAGSAVIAGSSIMYNIQAEQNPFTLGLMGITALGFAAICYGMNKYAKNDEIVLEKTFGQEYRDYKATTPRYFPAVWKLFSRKDTTPRKIE